MQINSTDFKICFSAGNLDAIIAGEVCFKQKSFKNYSICNELAVTFIAEFPQPKALKPFEDD